MKLYGIFDIISLDTAYFFNYLNHIVLIMGKKTCWCIFLIVLILVGGGMGYLLYTGQGPFFYMGDRYDSSRINMTVIYEKEEDQYGFFESYSTTSACPWGFEHNGIDYFFKNGTNVIAAAPGKLIMKELRASADNAANPYSVLIQIRFNRTVTLEYNFEMFSTNISDRDHQSRLLTKKVGDWVEKGEIIAKFLYINAAAHIHFGIKVDNKWDDPIPYFSIESLQKLVQLMHVYHPDWEYLSYNSSTFYNGARYNPVQLNYMDVIFEDASDIYTLNDAWSNTTDCPWARVHEGLDIAFKNASKVLIAAPGIVERIELKDWGPETENRYMIGVVVRFNASIQVGYNFEPWTNISADFLHQQALLNVSEGDWVDIGDELGIFLNIGPGAHVHWDMIWNQNARPPMDQFMSSTGYTKMLNLVQSYHPSWAYFCYYGQPW